MDSARDTADEHDRDFGPPLERIFLPSDFSEASHVAFVHALRFAVSGPARLEMLHVAGYDEDSDWHDFPGVRETLEQWGLLPPGSDRQAVGRLGFDVEKIIKHHSDPVEACVTHLVKTPADLIVLSTHRHEGALHWFGRRVAQPLAGRAGEAALFLPVGVDGFVATADGTVHLRNVLVPIDRHPRPQRAVEMAARVAGTLGGDPVRFTLFHVGEQADMPAVHGAERPGWTWDRRLGSGDPAEAILELAETLEADLLVMTTEGRHGFLDALRGSTSERVLRHCRCPLLVIPPGG